MISTLSEVIGSNHHSIQFSFPSNHYHIFESTLPIITIRNRFNQLKSRILIISSFIIYHSHSILHISTSSSIHLHYPHNIYSSFYLNSSIEIYSIQLILINYHFIQQFNFSSLILSNSFYHHQSLTLRVKLISLQQFSSISS